MDLPTHTLCNFCATLLTRGISALERRHCSFPINIAEITGDTARPDLDFIRKSSLTGCRLCSQMLHIHWTRICNGYDGTTKESDAEEALEAVSLKFPRISIDMVAQDGDDEWRPHWLLVYKHSVLDDEPEELLNVYDNEAGPAIDDTAELSGTSDVTKSAFGHLGNAVLDTDAVLHTMLEVMKSCKKALCEHEKMNL